MTNREREKEIERYLVKRVNKVGGIAYKFVSPGNRGVPDRIVLLPTGVIVFAELKTTKGFLSSLQWLHRKRISNLHFPYCFINCKNDVDLMLMELGF